MGILHTGSLGATVDAVNEAALFGRSIPKAERSEAAHWIASRVGQAHGYRGLPAPTKAEVGADGIRLFTGERVTTDGGRRHILGQEACRALLLLDAGSKHVRESLAQATQTMGALLTRSRRSVGGMYCCGKCSVSLWRHMAAGGFREIRDRMLAEGMKTLAASADGKGRWRRFPFYYLLSALAELDAPGADAARRYAAPACERLLRTKPKDERYNRRRRAIAEAVLNRI